MNVSRSGIALCLVGFISGCSAASLTPGVSQSPGPSTVPSGTNNPSEAATSEPTPSATAPSAEAVQVWQNWSLATVRVNGLNVRTGPGLSEPVVPDEIGQFEAGGLVRLDAGDHLLVMGTVESDAGRQWVQIGAQQVGTYSRVVVGWVDAGTAGDPWVDGSESGCPGAEPSFDTLLQLSGLERMGCYAAAPLTFAAHQATIPPNAGLGGACGEQAVPWLLCDHINYNWVNRDGRYDWEFLLHFDPATGVAPTGLAKEGESRPLDITGHFMDPQATSCAPNPPMTNEDMAQYLSCSTMFVVETIE